TPSAVARRTHWSANGAARTSRGRRRPVNSVAHGAHPCTSGAVRRNAGRSWYLVRVVDAASLLRLNRRGRTRARPAPPSVRGWRHDETVARTSLGYSYEQI